VRRLFFALWPSDALKAAIEHATCVAAQQSGGRIVAAQNLHITLAFLGSVAEARIQDLQRLASHVSIEPFELVLGELRLWKRQALLCLEPTSGLDSLGAWVDRLRVSLEQSGFEIERRPFRPHVTLAREVRREVDVQTRLPSADALRWTVHGMELMESTLNANGSSYRVVTRDERLN
jgi:2'-5' RNA ligase